MRSSNHPFHKTIVRIKNYDKPAIERAREIIGTNLTDHWSLALLASKAGINEYKLKIGFRELYKTTPYQYLVRLRLEKAKALLEDTDLSIQLVADRVGFNTYRGFSKAFKKIYGVLPTKYRVQEDDYYNEYIALDPQL